MSIEILPRVELVITPTWYALTISWICFLKTFYFDRWNEDEYLREEEQDRLENQE